MNREFRASIDIGSNSVLLLVADVSFGKLVTVSRKSEITSLGRELDIYKTFHPEAMEATYNALKSYAEECDQYQIPRGEIIVTATEASRVAKNASTFFQRISDELLLNVEIITPQAEAYYSARGILFNTQFDDEFVTIMDIGGASTELIKVNTKKMQILDSISLPIGAVRSTQWLKDDLFVQNLQKVFLDFRTEIDKFQDKQIFCVAGTMTSLGNMHLKRREFIEDDVQGLILQTEDIDSLFKKYCDYKSEQFLDSFPFLEKRSSSIRGGLYLTYHLIHRLLVRQLTISTFGLRYGTLVEGRVRREFIYGKS